VLHPSPVLNFHPNPEMTWSLPSIGVSLGQNTLSLGRIKVSLGQNILSFGCNEWSIGRIKVSLGCIEVSVGRIIVSLGFNGVSFEILKVSFGLIKVTTALNRLSVVWVSNFLFIQYKVMIFLHSPKSNFIKDKQIIKKIKGFCQYFF
jgi:hypothetical protein